MTWMEGVKSNWTNYNGIMNAEQEKPQTEKPRVPELIGPLSLFVLAAD